jgi:exonuclease SbcC
MILKKLIIENIRSYEKQEIVFPSGSTLLSGDIGSGKTTVLLAIEFALFGLQPSQRGTSLLRTGEKACKVVLEFEIDDKQVVIERTLKRHKKSVTQDYNSVTIDNERFEGSVTEIKSKVLRLLNYPLEFSKKTNLLYKFTVYTPQEEMKQIILEPGDLRLNTLRHVFGIDKYKRIEENTALIGIKLRERIRVFEGMVYDLEKDKEVLEAKKTQLLDFKKKQDLAVEDFKKAILEREEKEKALQEIQDKIDEKKSLETEKAKTNVLINEKKSQTTSLRTSIHNLNLQVEEAKKIKFDSEEFESLNKRIEFQQSREDELQKEYIHIISKINAELSKKNETEELKNKISGLQRCPTCLQEVSESYKQVISEKTDEEIQRIQKIINELGLKKNQLSEQIDLIKKAREDYKKRKSELELLKIKFENLKEKESRIREVEEQRDVVEKDLEILQKHIKIIEKSISEYEKYAVIFEHRNKELQTSKNKENEMAIKKAEINKEIQFLEQQIKEKREEIKKKQDLKTKTEKLREIEYWVSKKFLDLVLFTEKQVMITLKEEFSRLFSKWFSILVSETLNAKLDDDFSPIVEQQDYELDYSFLSGGERTAIALAYRLSLNQVINSMISNIKTSDLVILDEPTDGFSAQQLDKMRDVLHQLNANQLIVVSHEPKIEGFVDNIIRLRKENNLSGIEE